jgi:hypothetical protein
MAYFRTGTATIDKDFKIIRADQGFYQFIGWETPQFLEQSVDKEDFPKLEAVMQSVFSSGERELLTYRVLRPDESLHWVFADISREKLGDEGDFLCLNIQSVEQLDEELNIMGSEIRELGVYLDLMDELFFKYNIRKDEFHLLWEASSSVSEFLRAVLMSGNSHWWITSCFRKSMRRPLNIFAMT